MTFAGNKAFFDNEIDVRKFLILLKYVLKILDALFELEYIIENS